MTDDEHDEFATWVVKYADKSSYAWGLKGIPREDKHFEEKEVARLVLKHMDVQPISIRTEPGGRDTPPDVAADLADGTSIGIEVTELVDGPMRAKHASRRSAERKLGLTAKAAGDAVDQAFNAGRAAGSRARQNGGDAHEAFLSTYLAQHPTPDHVSSFAFTNWTVEMASAKLDDILRAKDKKLLGRSSTYNEVILAIFSDEPTITREVVLLARKKCSYVSNNINRTFVVLGYDPAEKIYPVVELLHRESDAS